MTQQQKHTPEPTQPVIEAEIEAVPGIPAELDCGVLWIRTGWDLEAEWPRMLAAFMAAELDPVTGEPAGHEGLRVTGFYFAANWTARMSLTAPVTNKPERVTGRTLTEQMSTAERVSKMTAPEASYALGVLEWLEWMTGRRAHLVYPARAV